MSNKDVGSFIFVIEYRRFGNTLNQFGHIKASPNVLKGLTAPQVALDKLLHEIEVDWKATALRILIYKELADGRRGRLLTKLDRIGGATQYLNQKPAVPSVVVQEARRAQQVETKELEELVLVSFPCNFPTVNFKEVFRK